MACSFFVKQERATPSPSCDFRPASPILPESRRPPRRLPTLARPGAFCPASASLAAALCDSGARPTQTCPAGPDLSCSLSERLQRFWARHPLIQATGSSGTPSPPDGLCGLLATGYYFYKDAGDHPRDDGALRVPRRRGLHVGPLGLAAPRRLPLAGKAVRLVAEAALVT